MRILSYFGILIVLTQLSLIDAIKKEYQGIIMQDSDGMKLIVEDSHSKKNKLQNTLSQEDSSSKREFFDQSSIFDYFSQNNLKKQDEAQASEESKEESEEEVPEESEEEKEDEEEEDTEKEESEASEDGEQQSKEEKDSPQKKDSSKKDDSKEQKNEQPETEEQPKQKQTIIPLKGSENSIIITGDGETYFMRYDPITQTSQMMNMNTIKDVDFKKNTFTIDTSSSNKQKLEKYTIPTYEPFEWYQVLSEGELPQKRGGHTIIAVGQNVILFGGCQQDIQCFNDLYFYDIMELSWSTSKIFGEPPSPRSGHSATLVGSYLYIFGGSNEHGILSDLHRLNLPNRVWEQFEFEGPKPPGRTNHKAVLDNQGRIVFFGGFTVQGYSNDVYFLDLVNMRWSKPLINGEPPRPRENFSMNLVRDSYIWVFGGYALGGETNDLWQLDVDGMRWTRMLQSFGVKPIERQGHQMLLHGKLLYTLGGCNYKEQRCFNDVYQLNIDDLTWTKMEFVLENSLKERDNYGMALMGSNMYIFGGCEMMQKCYNDFLVMNITDICPKNCTGRGTCRNNRCQCQDGFFGEQCEIEMKCEYNCSNRGICGTDGNCKCYRGFTGRICEIYVPCPSNCTSIDNGLCEPNGTCLCNEGYKGLACEVGRKGLLDITIKCPNKCSNHGECNEETGICICEDGYGDLDCSLTIEEWEKEQKEKKEKAEKEKKLKEEKEKKEKEAKDNKGKSGEEASAQEADSTTTQEGEVKPDTEEGAEKIEGESSQQEEQAGETAGDQSTTVTQDNQTETTEQTETDQPDTEQSESTTEQPTEEQVSEGSNTSESTTAASSDGTENAEVEQLSESELSKSEEIAKLIHMSIKQNQQQEQKDSLADCENNCSFNGVCVSEECYCKPGFTGPDCSAFKISHLQKGIKAVKLFFYVPIFLLIGIIIGYFYLKQAQEAQEEQEFGEIEDYHEDAKQRNTQDLNTHLNSGLNKNQYVEDQNDYDSVSSIKIDDSNVDGSSGTDQEHSVKDDLQQSNIFLRKPDKENVENPQGSQQIIPLQDRDSNNLDD